MKNMKRIISLLMALMLMGSSVTANADMIVSNSEGIRLRTVVSETNTDLNHFLTDASITDPRTHQEVTGQVESGRNYKIRVEFSEGNRDNQFQVNGNHQMIYRFPEGLTVRNLDGQYPVTVGGVKIGIYTIQGNTLAFTPWYSTDQVNYEPYNAEEMQGNPNYKTYADFAVNTKIWFDVVGQFTETEGNFKFTDSLNKEWNVVPERNEPVIELQKESQYDKEANKFHYTIRATVTNADAGDLTITDALADMMGMKGIDRSTLKITKQIGTAEGSDYKLNGENDETITWTDKEPPDDPCKVGFTMTLKDVKKDDTFIIEYDAPIDTATLETALGENDVGLTIGHNRVTAAAKDTNSQADWWGKFFPGKKPIQKQYVGQPESDKSILKWKLTVGSKNETNPENKVNGKTVEDTWRFDTNIDSVSLDKTADVKIALYPFGDGQKQEIILKKGEVSQYLTEKTDGTGFIFTVPNPELAFDVKYCEVEYQTDCRMKDESEGGTSAGKGDVTNTAEFGDGDQSASATGTAGGEKPLPELNPTKTLVDSNADELVFRYTVDIPREYIGREKVWFEDEFILKDGYSWYWIYNRPSRIAVTAVGKKSRKERPITAGTGAYTYQYCKETGGENIKKFYLFFNANEKIENADNSGSKSGLWAWDEDEDVTLTIEYAISKQELVSNRAYGGYMYPDDYDKKISEVTKGVLVNTGKINNKDATAELNITRKVVKHAEITDSETGEVTYTVDLNKTGLNQIPENAIFTDTYDDHMEFVDGSLRVYITREDGEWAKPFVEMEYSGACVDETKHQISFGFGQSSWKVKKEILPYFIEQHYGSIENFKAAVQDGSWYRKENQNENENRKYPWIRIEYRLRLKDQYVDGNPYRVKNTAKLGDWVSASASATVKPKMLKKSMTSDGSLLKYAITVNPSGSQLGDGKKLTLTDVMTNLSPMMDSSLKVIDKETNTELKRGTDWDIAYDAESHKMTFTLPNSRTLEIQYSARATGTGKVNISNTAMLLGESSTVGKQDFNASDTSSGANQSAFGFQISKVKTGTKIGLEGAKFQITYFHKKDGEIKEFPFGSYTTNEYGVALIDQGNDKECQGNDRHIYSDTVYRIVETKAPEGYEASGQERYIYIASKEDSLETDSDLKAIVDSLEGKTVTKCVNWETITIENSPASQKFPFSFTKTDPSGQSLPGAAFTLTGENYTQTATSGENGTVTFTDLKPGKIYQLEETRAPGGYLLSTETWTIEVEADGSMTVTDGSDKTVEKPDGGYRFANREIPTLPSVGGRGTAVYGLLGLALMAMATATAYTLARRKKASGAE